MSEALVQMQDAGRTYLQGGIPIEALKSATCRVLPGDRIAMVGPSGSGKSTLLHLMGGLDAPTSGSISWPLLGVADELRPGKIGVVFQWQSLLPSLSVVENVSLPLLLMDAVGEDAHTQAMDLLARFGLDALADRLPEELSGGQLQRVAVARSLAARPRLILADEPTGQLDHPTAMNLLDTLLAHVADTDTALVIATHNAAVAERMATTWRMHHGVLEGTDQ